MCLPLPLHLSLTRDGIEVDPAFLHTNTVSIAMINAIIGVLKPKVDGVCVCVCVALQRRLERNSASIF